MINEIKKEDGEFEYIIFEDEDEFEDEFSWEEFIKAEVKGRIADFEENDS